ncbi:MAG: histidinol-phosphatase HisJ family protein [Candidatus Melainabacteria bacterium]|nr:histidinol-phosphatase HisJ family protein [Candidatus Melainabacteria bacterium]
MLFSDYHNHPQGHRDLPYTKEVLEPWAKYARKVQLKDVALTDHGRYHPGINLDEFFKFRDSVKDVKFKIGVEIDNDPETSKADYQWMEKNYNKLDFVLGSVHFIDDWPYDHPAHKEKFNEWDIDELYGRYFAEMKNLINKGFLDGLAHVDLIKIFGHRQKKEIEYYVKDVLKLIKEKGLTVEMSTAGWRKPVNEQYPQEKIIEMIKQMDIPITTASDAHTAKDVGYGYDRLYEMLKKYGFNQVAVFDNHKMTLLPI